MSLIDQAVSQAYASSNASQAPDLLSQAVKTAFTPAPPNLLSEAVNTAFDPASPTNLAAKAQTQATANAAAEQRFLNSDLIPGGPGGTVPTSVDSQGNPVTKPSTNASVVLNQLIEQQNQQRLRQAGRATTPEEVQAITASGNTPFEQFGKQLGGVTASTVGGLIGAVSPEAGRDIRLTYQTPASPYATAGGIVGGLLHTPEMITGVGQAAQALAAAGNARTDVATRQAAGEDISRGQDIANAGMAGLINLATNRAFMEIPHGVAGSLPSVGLIGGSNITQGTATKAITGGNQDITPGSATDLAVAALAPAVLHGLTVAVNRSAPATLNEATLSRLEAAAEKLKAVEPQNAQEATPAAPGSTEGQGGATPTLVKAPNALPASLEGYTPQVRIPGTAENNAVPLSFADPKEMAAYVVATGRDGKRAADARQWLQGQGLDDDAINDLARKSRLRAQRAAEQGFSTLPTQTPDINEANRIAPEDYTPQHQNISDISEAFRGRKPNLYDADDKMAGYVSPDGETWLNVRNIRSPKDLMDTIGHEAMHGYQQDYPDLTDQWWQKTPKDIQDQEADRYQQKWRSIPGQENWTHPNDVERQAEAQATLAGRLASDPKIADRIFRQDPGFIRRFVEWIQDRFGPNKMPPEVRAYVQTMREALARNQGEGTIEPGAGTRPEVNQAKPSSRKGRFLNNSGEDACKRHI